MTQIAVKPKRKSKRRDVVFPVVNTIVLCILMFITVYPVINTLAVSFNDGSDAVRGGIGLIPRKFSLEAYTTIFTGNEIIDAFKISVIKTIITTVLNLFLTSMLSFALSRKEYVFRKFITVVLVLTMYINAGLVPNFLLVSKVLGLKNTFWVYIIPSMFSCFNMIVIRTYICGLPEALVESARIDGASDIVCFFRIIMPLCLPVLATVALFVAVGCWNSWFDTFLYCSGKTKLHTLQYVLMQKLNSLTSTLNQANRTADANQAVQQQASTVTVRAAISVIAAVPILAIYPFLQRYFVTGMALGSVKG